MKTVSPHIRYIRLFFLCLLVAAGVISPFCQHVYGNDGKTPGTERADELSAQALEAFARGDFGASIRKWEAAIRLYKAEEKEDQEADTLLRLAKAYQAMGQYRNAKSLIVRSAKLLIPKDDAANCLEPLRRFLEEASEVFPKTDSLSYDCLRPPEGRMRLAKLMGSLGQICQFIGQTDRAETCLNIGLSMITKTESPGVTAAILNAFGNLLAATRDYDGAVLAYIESGELARQSGKMMFAAKAAVNAARVLYKNKAFPRSIRLLRTALDDMRDIRDCHDKAYALIAAGQLMYRIPSAHMPSDLSADEMTELVYQAFRQAREMAEKLCDHAASSYALGYLGKLCEDQGRYNEALELTRKAVFAAQGVNEVKSLYRWQWQTGRLLAAMGDTDAAISAYLRSADALESVRKNISEDCHHRNTSLSFREAVGTVYFEMADLLLRRGNLSEALKAIEKLKAVELQDYFQDECVTAMQERQTRLDQISLQRCAVLYPILFPERTELVIRFSDKLMQFTIPVDAKRLTSEVREFRTRLQQPGSTYLPLAQKIYDRLIRPIEDELNERETETLVFVPDGELRTIPMAALHDGQRFLIDKYAIAVTPGLEITDPRPVRWDREPLLLSGLTASVQGFPSLPNVASELDEIQKLCACRILRDQDFTLPALEAELEATSYPVVHIASHGQFDRDSEKTFLLTYDGRISMDRLEDLMGMSRFREKPVMFLTLSACQTAVGDDRAALGLAGVAVRAGARGVLATLWFVNDAATSRLVADFYRRQFEDPSLSKAKALQMAQTALLKNPNWQHPAYWAPFLVIGNWL